MCHVITLLVAGLLAGPVPRADGLAGGAVALACVVPVFMVTMTGRDFFHSFPFLNRFIIRKQT